MCLPPLDADTTSSACEKGKQKIATNSACDKGQHKIATINEREVAPPRAWLLGKTNNKSKETEKLSNNYWHLPPYL